MLLTGTASAQFYEIEVESNFPDIRLYTPDENHFLRVQSANGEEPFSLLHFSDQDIFKITSGNMTLGNLRNLMVFQPDGNIGVNELFPTALFHLKRNASDSIVQLQITEDDLDFARVRFNSTDTSTFGQYWDMAVRTFPDSLQSEFKLMYNNGARDKNIAIFKSNGIHLLNSFTDDNIIGMWSDSGNIALNGILNGNYLLGPTGQAPKVGILFLTRGTARGTIDTSGNYGIGTIAPNSLLHIQKNSSTSEPQVEITEEGLDFSRIAFNNTDNSTDGIFYTIAARPHSDPVSSQFNIYHDNGTEAGNIMEMRASGLTILHSFTDVNVQHFETDSGFVARNGIDLGRYRLGTTNNLPDAAITLETNSAVRMTIDPQGEVGIGETNPDAPLHIRANSSLTKPSVQITENGLDFSRILFNNTDGSTSGQYYTLAARPHSDPVSSQFNVFYDNGTESGNIMEMRASGLTILHSFTDLNVQHFETDSGFVARNGIDLGRYRIGTTNNLPNASLTLETNSAIRMTIAEDGDVGVNTSTPQAQLDINGKIKVADDGDSEMDGHIRYNSNDDKFQGYADGQWRDFHNLSPDTMVYTVNYSEVTPDLNQNFTIANPGNVYMNSGPGTFYGPVHLPQGAQIVDATVYFVDNSDEDVGFGIVRTPLTGTSYNPMFSYDSNAFVSGDSDSIEEEPMTDTDANLIDNTQYAYLVSSTCADWSSDVRFKAVVIRYVVP